MEADASNIYIDPWFPDTTIPPEGGGDKKLQKHLPLRPEEHSLTMHEIESKNSCTFQ
jgi:hypothetical protein